MALERDPSEQGPPEEMDMPAPPSRRVEKMARHILRRLRHRGPDSYVDNPATTSRLAGYLATATLEPGEFDALQLRLLGEQPPVTIDRYDEDAGEGWREDRIVVTAVGDQPLPLSPQYEAALRARQARGDGNIPG